GRKAARSASPSNRDLSAAMLGSRARAYRVNQQEHVLAILFGKVERVTVQILRRYWQIVKTAEDGATYLGKFLGRVRANVKHLRSLLCRERIQPHRKECHLSGAAGGFIKSSRVGVEASGRVFIDCADVGGVLAI